jgi:hypothetical protein
MLLGDRFCPHVYQFVVQWPLRSVVMCGATYWQGHSVHTKMAGLRARCCWMVGFATRVSDGSWYGACLLVSDSGSVRAFTLFFCGGWNFDEKAGSESVIRDFDSSLFVRKKTKILLLPHMHGRSARQFCNPPNWPKTKNVFCIMRSNFVRFRGRRSCPGIEPKIVWRQSGCDRQQCCVAVWLKTHCWYLYCVAKYTTEVRKTRIWWRNDIKKRSCCAQLHWARRNRK